MRGVIEALFLDFNHVSMYTPMITCILIGYKDFFVFVLIRQLLQTNYASQLNLVGIGYPL